MRSVNAQRAYEQHPPEGHPDHQPSRVFYSRPNSTGEIVTYHGVSDYVRVPREAPFGRGVRRGGGKRREAGIYGMARQSRQRYLRCLVPGMPAVMAESIVSGRAFLGTFTYGLNAGNHGIEKVEAVRHLKNLRWYLTTRGWCGMWSREIQDRGALHWHVVCRARAGARADLESEHISTWWTDYTGLQGSSRGARLLHGVRIDWIRPESGPAQLASYIAKHESKGGQRSTDLLVRQSTGEVVPLGRAWGHLDRPAWEQGCVEATVSHDAEGAAILAQRQIVAAYARGTDAEVLAGAISRGHRYRDVYVHAPAEDIGRQARFVQTGSETELRTLARWPDGTGPDKRRRSWGEVREVMRVVRERWPRALAGTG